MSMANVAELLYQSGLKVLMIDFDLEAPGLERFFDVPPEVQGHRGVIDLVHSFKALRALPGMGSAKKGQANNKFPFRVEPLLNFIVTIHEDSDGGALYLIPAGERPKDDYSRFTERVRTFDWDDFYLNWNGQEFFDWFRREANTIADVILVDSRTGITEMSGICTYHLADIVVMFVAANRQNLDGTSLIAEGLFKRNLDREAKLKNGEKPEQRGDQRQSVEILPVPSRIDLTESPSLNKFKAEFKEKLRKFTPEKLIFENNSFDDLKVPYIPRYAFFEKLAVAEPDQSVATDLIGAYGRIVSAMVQLASKDSRFFREYHRRSGRYSVLGPGATIPEPTQYFIGRGWILQSMDAWLSDSSPAVCLVTGEPGSGKTSLAYQLAMISQGEIGSEGLTNIGLGTLVYAHFCHPANVRTLDPLNFVRSAALALSSRFPEFVQALVEINGSDNTIEVQQKISATTAGGRIMKTQIGNISVEGLDVRTAYARLLLEPLNLMYKRGFSEPVIFLIDAIEATLTYEPVDNRQYDSDLIDNGSTDNEPRDNLVSLAALAMRRLPRQVRLILTSRSNPRVRRAFDKAMVMDLVTDSPDAVAGDIRSYALKMLELFPEEERSSIVDRIVGASSGNFLFAELLLNQILRESAKNEPIEVDLLPNGLEDVYQEYLQREIGSNLRRWNNQDALLLGVLAVSRAKGLTKQQLAGILNKSETKIDEMLEPWIQYLEGESPDGPFQPFHTSFRNFLLANQEYQIHPMEAHQAISNYFVKEYEGRWKKDVDEYALNYTPTHIVAALNAAKRRKDYLALKESLTALLADNSFLSAKADKFGFEELAKDLKKAPPDDAILGNLGLIYYYLREYDDAVITYEQALNMAREQRDKRAEYTILGNLGLAYRALGECEKAIVYYEQAVDIARSLKDRKSEGTNLGNLGLTFRDFGQMEKAEEMLEWALTIAREIGDISNESNWLGNLGNIYFDREQFEKAVEYYSQAQNLSRKNKERGGMGTWARTLV